MVNNMIIDRSGFIQSSEGAAYNQANILFPFKLADHLVRGNHCERMVGD